MNNAQRPSWDCYFLDIAQRVASRSSCLRRQVGAIIVKGKAIISTGYNGTPMGLKNCSDGGCTRCQSDQPSGQGYDTCLCVHAEQNAIALAARHGNAVEGCTLYTTLRPCFGCVKELIQAGIVEVVYQQDYGYPPEQEETYDQLIRESQLAFRRYSNECEGQNG